MVFIRFGSRTGWGGSGQAVGVSEGGAIIVAPFFHTHLHLSSQAVVGSEMAHFQSTWGQHGGWDGVWGHSVGSGSMFHCSQTALHGPKWGGAE